MMHREVASKRARGFTLIEQLLVIVIIGILAAISIPPYNTYVMRAKLAEGMMLLTASKSSIAEYYANEHTMPRFFDDIGLAERKKNSPFQRVFGFQSEIWDRVMVRRQGGGKFLELRLRSYRKKEWGNDRIYLYLQAKVENDVAKFRCNVNEDPRVMHWVPSSCRSGKRNQWDW